jgi:hypothetical protein
VRRACGELPDRLHLLRLAERLLAVAAAGHVKLAGELIGELAILVVHRADEQRVPERRAVALVVEQFGRHRAAFQHRLADFGHRFAVGHRALQETAVAAEDLAFLIAGEVKKRLVGEHDRIVVLVGVGQDHRHPRHLNRREEHIAAYFQARVRDDAFAPMIHAGRIPHRVRLVETELALGRDTADLTFNVGSLGQIAGGGADFVGQVSLNLYASGLKSPANR